MSCISCGRDFHDECSMDPCCCNQVTDEVPATANTQPQAKKLFPSHQVTDEKSTGRKRAESMYPKDPNAYCEWRLQTNNGGGKHPIVGCIGGLQESLHHGPNKNTLNNHRQSECKDPYCSLPPDAPSNVHKICHTCHNTWHSKNNKDYDPSIVHQPVSVTEVELFELTTKTINGTI